MQNASNPGLPADENAKRSAVGKARKSAARAASTARKTAQKAASKISEEAENVAEETMGMAKSKAIEAAEHGKGKAQDVVRSIGRAFEAGSRSLEEDGMMGTAGYVRAAASGLQQAADEVDGFKTHQLAGRVEHFVRSRPMLTVGALALAGFFVANSLKAPRDRG